MDALGHLLEKCIGNLCIGRVFLQVNWDQELFCLRIDIANVDTAFVGEEDPVALEVDC